MLRLLDIFWVKNSSPFFSKLVRVRASNLYTLLIGIIKPYHYYYRYFLLRPLVSEIFAGPFHKAKAVLSSFNVSISTFKQPNFHIFPCQDMENMDMYSKNPFKT